MCRLGRERRETYEGGGETGGRTERTEDARKWNEGPSGEVEGNGNPRCRSLAKIKPTDPLRLSKETTGSDRN